GLHHHRPSVRHRSPALHQTLHHHRPVPGSAPPQTVCAPQESRPASNSAPLCTTGVQTASNCTTIDPCQGLHHYRPSVRHRSPGLHQALHHYRPVPGSAPGQTVCAPQESRTASNSAPPPTRARVCTTTDRLCTTGVQACIKLCTTVHHRSPGLHQTLHH
ncbi:hypothetical protein NDU88_008782, partial [Pleurodeles waltl]